MGTETTIDYCLPLTKIRLRATVTETTDEIVRVLTLRGATKAAVTRTAERTLTIVTLADPDRSRELKVESGAMRDYAFDVGLTDDGRLTSVSAETTGHLGQILTAGATLVGTALALATGNIPLAAMVGAAGATATAEKPLGKAAEVKPLPLPEQQVWHAYKKAHPNEAERLNALTSEHETLVEELDGARRDLRQNVRDETKRKCEQQAVATLRRLKADNERELDRANQHFAAWRAGTLTERKLVYDELVDVVSLPDWNNGVLTFVRTEEGKRVEAFFAAALGVAATIGDAKPSAQTADGAFTEPTGETDELHFLRPRPVRLAHVEGTVKAAKLMTSERVLVMDHSSAVMSIPIRKSRTGKRSTSVSVSESGALATVTYGGTSSVDAGMQAAAGLPSAFGAALETVSKSRSTLDGLRAAPQERELAALKRTVDLEEQRLKLAGQSATATDYADVERLKQQAEIAELRAKLRDLGVAD